MQQQRLIDAARAQGLAAYQAGDLRESLHQLSYVFQHVKDDLEVNLTFAEARAKLAQPDGRHLLEAVDLFTTHGLRLIDATASAHEIPDRDAKKRHILRRLLELYSRLGMRYELTRTADDLLALEPTAVDALEAKAKVMMFEHRFDEAVPIAERLIEIQPDQIRWRRLLIEVRLGQGLPREQLMEVCRQWARDFEGDGRFRLLTCGLLIDMDRIPEARAEIEAAAALGADSEEVLQSAVTLLDLMDMRQLADDLVQTTQKRFANQQWCHEVGIRRLWHANRIEEALNAVNALRQEDLALSATLHRLKILVLLSSNHLDQARASLGLWLSRPGDQDRTVADHDRAWAAAVLAYMDLNASTISWQACVESLRQGLAQNPTDAALHLMLGDIAAKQGEYVQALNSYETASLLEPNWTAANLARANMLLATGRLDEAYEVSRNLVSRAPRNQLAPLLTYVKAYIAAHAAGMSGLLAGAGPQIAAELVRVLDQLHQEMPDQPELAATLVQAYVRLGDTKKANDLIDAVLKQESPDEAMLLALADASRRAQLGYEMQLLARAQQIAGLSPQTTLAHAESLSEAGNFDAALRVLEQAIAQGSDGPDVQCARVGCMLRMQHAGAIDALWQLIDTFRDNASVQRFALSQPAAWDQPELAEAAIANLKAVLGQHTPQVRLAEATLLLRNSARSEAMLARAIVQISDVLDRWPDSLAALSLMAEALTQGDHPNLPRAIEMLERAVSLYPGEAGLIVRLVELSQRMGDYAKAGRYLQRLAQLAASDPRLRLTQFQLLQAQGDFESALASATSLITEQSPVPDQLVLAAMHARAGKLDEAEAIYARLLDAGESADLVRAEAAEFYAMSNRFERGLELLQSLNPPGGEAERALTIGMYLQRHGRLEQAEQWLRRAVQANPQSVEALHALARVELSGPNPDLPAARKLALQGLAIDPQHTGLRATLAIISLEGQAGDITDAIKLLREVGSANDDLLAMLTLIEQVQRETRTGSQASDKRPPTDEHLAAAEQLLQSHGNFLPCWQLAIALQVEAGRLNEAISLARRAAARFPAQSEPNQWAVQLLAQAGRWDEAMVDAQEWRRRTVLNPLPADCAIAQCLVERNRPADAVTQLTPHAQRLVQERDIAPDRFAIWVRVLAMSGQLQTAEDLVQPLLRSDVRWRRMWIEIVGKLASADAYEALLRMESIVSDPQELLMLATTWLEVGKRASQSDCLDRAAVLASKAGEDERFATQSLIAQGLVAEAREQWNAAEALYRRVIEREPQSLVAMNNLAFVLAMQGRHAEALTHIQRAMSRQPNQPDLLDTYALVLLGMNRPAEAEQAMQQALTARPGDVGFILTLIQVQLQQNQLAKASELIDDVQHRLEMQAQADPQHQRRLEALRIQLANSRASVES